MKNVLSKICRKVAAHLPNGLRLMMLRMRHRDCWIGDHALIDRTKLLGDNGIGHFSQVFDCTLGRHSYINNNSFIGHTVIGSFTSIGPGCVAGIGAHPTRTIASTSPKIYLEGSLSDENFFEAYKETKIGSDVWIGAHVTICQGITIGDGAIIGANSVVTQDIPPFSVWGGAPARQLRSRFTDTQVEKLMRLRWWEKDDDWIRDNINLFKDIDRLCQQ